MKNIFLAILILFIASCSSGRTIDIKSPCVSGSKGPCGPKKSVNDWWLKNNGTVVDIS